MPKRSSYAGRYADYFNNSGTSDVKVVIKVANNENSLARRQLQLQGDVCQSAKAGELWANSVILMGNSPVWKAQLERWQGTHKRKTMTIIVEEGEQPAAHRLVQCLYTDSLPDIETEADLRITLGISMLADQYEVKVALALCAEKLEMLTDLGAISWELADSVMQLPAAFLENPGLSCLVVKIQEKILKHVATESSLPDIGLDLEVVMRDSTLQKGLMALSLRKCASLLSDDRCRVASESTVAAAVVRRLEHEASRSGNGDVEHVQSAKLRAQIMCDVIRVPHLSPLFAAAMPAFASQLTPVIRPETYALGRELDRLPAALRENLTKHASIPRCWLSKPPSTVTALEFAWEASTPDLAENFDSGAAVLARSPMHCFAGIGCDVYWGTAPSPGNEGRTVAFYISPRHPLLGGAGHQALLGAMVNVDILRPDKSSTLHRHAFFGTTAGTNWYWPDFFEIPPMQKWDQSRMQKWTSSDGFLTVRVKVTDFM